MECRLKSFIEIFILLIVVCLCKGHIEDMRKYKQMPPLYMVDDYDRCLGSDTNSYCVVYEKIQENPESSLWQYMDEFYRNSTWTHFRHDLLYRGVCTGNCKQYPKVMKQWNKTAMQPQDDNVKMAVKQYALSGSQKSIAEYEQQLHQCLNNEMQQQYNLSVKTFVRYCDNPQEPIEKVTRYFLAISVFAAIIAINLMSTAYDVYLRNQIKEKELLKDYYNRKPINKVNYYLTIFSLYRNFHRLIQPNNSPIGNDLSFLDGYRTLLSFAIILEHVTLLQFFPHKNPELFEREFSTTFTKSLIHAVAIIELYFTMSSLLLCIGFVKSNLISPTTSWRECIRIFLRKMLSRYLRLMPSLLVFILFSNNMMLHTGRGPFWRHIMEPYAMQCRRHWWTNIFMLANRHPNSTCWPHTWYIAADFQLYAIFLAILIITTKYPQYKKAIYAVIGIWGLSVPSIINYAKKLNSITTFLTETLRHMYFKDIDTALNVYFKSYANVNGCLVGIICGELYMKYLRHEKYKKILRRFLKYSPLIGGIIIITIWYFGSKLIFQESTIWTAMFAIIHRHLSVVIVSIAIILRGQCTEKGFFSLPLFRLLARVSYQVYLWHMIIIYTIAGTYRHLPEYSYINMISMAPVFYMLSVIVATVLTTMVEYPIAELLKVFDLKATREQPNIADFKDQFADFIDTRKKTKITDLKATRKQVKIAED